jgi:hypothetical protein
MRKGHGRAGRGRRLSAPPRRGLSAGSLWEPPRRISRAGTTRRRSEVRCVRVGVRAMGRRREMRRGAGAERPRAQPRSATPGGAPTGSGSLRASRPVANLAPPAPQTGGKAPWRWGYATWRGGNLAGRQGRSAKRERGRTARRGQAGNLPAMSVLQPNSWDAAQLLRGGRAGEEGRRWPESRRWAPGWSFQRQIMSAPAEPDVRRSTFDGRGSATV